MSSRGRHGGGGGGGGGGRGGRGGDGDRGGRGGGRDVGEFPPLPSQLSMVHAVDVDRDDGAEVQLVQVVRHFSPHEASASAEAQAARRRRQLHRQRQLQRQERQERQERQDLRRMGRTDRRSEQHFMETAEFQQQLRQQLRQRMHQRAQDVRQRSAHQALRSQRPRGGPRYFCHQCLMNVVVREHNGEVDCRQCGGSFVEKVESEEDLRRFHFAQSEDDDDEEEEEGGIGPHLMHFDNLFMGSMLGSMLMDARSIGVIRGNLGSRGDSANRLGHVFAHLFQSFGGGNDQATPVPRACKRAVAGLPRIEVTASNLAQYKEDECVVCKDEFDVGAKLVKLPCGHLFHDLCLKPWLDKHNTCPTCRHELPKERAEPPRAPRRTQARQALAAGMGAASSSPSWASSSSAGTSSIRRTRPRSRSARPSSRPAQRRRLNEES